MKKTLLSLAAMLLAISQLFSQAEFNTGGIIVSVNEWGAIEVLNPGGIFQLDRASILVAGNQGQVYDYQNDMDVEEPTMLVTNPTLSDFEIYGVYNNAYSGDPPDVLVKQQAYGWTSGAFTVIRFHITNNESALLQARAGLDIIPYIDEEYGFDTVTYKEDEKVIRFHRGNQTNMGIKLLSAPLSSLFSFEWYDGYSVDEDYWTWMHTGTIMPQYVSTTADGPVSITSQAEVPVEPDASFDVYYAIAIGADEQTMLNNMAAAQEAYQALITGMDDPGLHSGGLQLDRNRPNPFTDLTTFRYSLPASGHVTLQVTDLVGNTVATLVDGTQSKGDHAIQFSGRHLPAGVYFYTLRFNDEMKTGKMMLVR